MFTESGVSVGRPSKSWQRKQESKQLNSENIWNGSLVAKYMLIFINLQTASSSVYVVSIQFWQQNWTYHHRWTTPEEQNACHVTIWADDRAVGLLGNRSCICVLFERGVVDYQTTRLGYWRNERYDVDIGTTYVSTVLLRPAFFVFQNVPPPSFHSTSKQPLIFHGIVSSLFFCCNTKTIQAFSVIIAFSYRKSSQRSNG